MSLSFRLESSPSLKHYGALFYKHALQWAVAFGFLIFYIFMMLLLHVPSYSYFNPDPNGITDLNQTFTVKCDTHGDLGPACNAARAVDHWILGWSNMYSQANHPGSYPELFRLKDCQEHPVYADCPKPPGEAPPWCYVPFDPEGTLTSFPTVLTTFIGFHFGNVLIHYKVSVRLAMIKINVFSHISTV
jgi:heparan-alpha-glucosaminide N-acetyltransferase